MSVDQQGQTIQVLKKMKEFFYGPKKVSSNSSRAACQTDRQTDIQSIQTQKLEEKKITLTAQFDKSKNAGGQSGLAKLNNLVLAIFSALLGLVSFPCRLT
jgi:hypothetical protein